MSKPRTKYAEAGRIWEQYFAPIYEPDAWMTEIAQIDPTPTEADVIMAIRVMARTKEKLPDKPTLRVLAEYIRRGSGGAGNAKVECCDLCHDGWIKYTPRGRNAVDIPCSCARGEYFASHQRDGWRMDRADLDLARAEAIRQNRAINGPRRVSE